MEEASTIIRAREMLTDAYLPKWITVLADGQRLRALAFVANTLSEHFAGEISENRQLEIIANASGCIGSAVNYLDSVIRELAILGIKAPSIERIQRRLESRVESNAEDNPSMTIIVKTS